MAFDKNKVPTVNSKEVKASDSINKTVDTVKVQAPVEHVTQQTRRLQQIPLTDLVINTDVYGTDFLLVKMDVRSDGRTDYQAASLKHNLDKIRITVNALPTFSSNVLNDGMKKITVTGLTARIWQTGNAAGVVFNADSVTLS